MAKQTLPVNFKDDILASSMGGKRRYNLIQNSDGAYSLEDVTEYTQTGSDFGAGQINATNKAVNDSCDKADVIDDPDDIFANKSNGKIAGAKAVAEIFGEKIYDESDLPIADFYDITDFDLRKRGNEVFFNVSLSMQPGTQFEPNTLYSIGLSPIISELIPSKTFYLNGFGCDAYWGNSTPMSVYIDKNGYIKYTAPSRGAFFKLSGHWFVD